MFNKTSRTETPETEAQHQPDETMDKSMETGAEAQPAQPTEEADVSEANEWQVKYQMLQDQYARLAADFDNYRKRTREEQESLVKYGAQKSILELLPVLDNLDRANTSLNENSDAKVLYKSFGMMQKQLLDGLDAMGVKKIQAIGQPFDPQRHEAVNRMESAEFPEDTIMYEAQSGYQLHDKVIRPAMVVVSMGAPGGESESAATDVAPSESEKQHNPFMK